MKLREVVLVIVLLLTGVESTFAQEIPPSTGESYYLEQAQPQSAFVDWQGETFEGFYDISPNIGISIRIFDVFRLDIRGLAGSSIQGMHHTSSSASNNQDNIEIYFELEDVYQARLDCIEPRVTSFDLSQDFLSVMLYVRCGYDVQHDAVWKIKISPIPLPDYMNGDEYHTFRTMLNINCDGKVTTSLNGIAYFDGHHLSIGSVSTIPLGALVYDDLYWQWDYWDHDDVGTSLRVFTNLQSVCDYLAPALKEPAELSQIVIYENGVLTITETQIFVNGDSQSTVVNSLTMDIELGL